jgi:hypothetical protein
MASKISEAIAVVGTIDPVTLDSTTGTATSDWVDMSQHHKLAFVVSFGDSASATLDAKLQEATDAAGTGAQDISGKSITQLDDTSGVDAQVVVEVASNELDHADSYRYVACVVTADGANDAPVSCVALADLRYDPASGADLATVKQIV